jgi:hypothetical protein
MPRPKSERHSSDLAAEIARLEQERKRSIQFEDQRRGAIIREILAGPASNSLQSTLQPLVAGRDAFLFGLEATDNSGKHPGRRSSPSTARPLVESTSRQSLEVGHSA